MKKPFSFFALLLMATTSFAACGSEIETDEDSDLLDGILADPVTGEIIEDTSDDDDEEPYVEPPTYLPGDEE